MEEVLEISYFVMIIPTSLLILLTAFFLTHKKKPIKFINEMEKDCQICAYIPEPLIDYNKIDFNSNKIIETHIPEEINPECINLVKVNYLNFLDNENLKTGAEVCIRKYGVGSCGPRGFYGTIDIHLTLEDRLSKFMEMEEAVLYSYGFSTIASAIGAYCKHSDIIFCDEKLNFPAKQGMLAAKSEVIYFKHNDMIDLEKKLMEYEEQEILQEKLYRKFLIVEGIYAATGTICPLPKLMVLRQKYKLRIFIDESLSIGVLGEKGRGVTEYFNVNRSDVDMIIGSLEGSVGSIGGFCVGASVIIDHQRLFGLGYCFSASLPPFLSGIAISVLDMFENDSFFFKNLKDIAIFVHEQLQSLDAYLIISDPISPLKVITLKKLENGVENIRQIQAYCKQQNIYLNFFEENILFNINIKLEKSVIKKIVQALKDAVLTITPT